MGKHTITLWNEETGEFEEYMTRWWIGRLRIHRFYRGDQDPDCHDHPWDFWTFPLHSYVEEVLTPAGGTTSREGRQTGYFFRKHIRTVERFRLHYRPAEHRHRVLGALDGHTWKPVGKVVTIVWRSPVKRKWGFWKHRKDKWCWQFWKDYIFDGGKHAPCDDETVSTRR